MSLLGQNKKQRLRTSAKLPKLTIEQQIQNNQVIQRMNRKITFTKNQRHLGSTITYQQALNGTINNKQGSLMKSVREGRQKFKSIPENIIFNHFEPHHTYESEIKLVNLSSVIQRIKITPFNLKQFNIYNVHYPKEDSGDVAPGMTVQITIRFRPLNLNDLSEQLIIIYNGGTIRIPIQAKRERPMIDWPKVIDCGHCWVGNTQQKSIMITNQGGQAEYELLSAHNSNQDQSKIGYFIVSPSILKFNKQQSQSLNVGFNPQKSGKFQQKIIFKSNQGEREEIAIELKGGAYKAQIILQQINGQFLKHQVVQNTLYLNGGQIGQLAKGNLVVNNLAVVDVQYFWHFQDIQNLHRSTNFQITNQKGKISASSALTYQISLKPQNRSPLNIRAELYLFNLPEKSLINKTSVKYINGIEAIQCLVVNIKTRVQQSSTEIFPLHRQIIIPVYKKIPIIDFFTISNHSNSKRSYKIAKISQTEFCQIQVLSRNEDYLQAKQQRKIQFSYAITQLSKNQQRGYFLIQFDNSASKVFSVGAFVQYPQLKFSLNQLYFGLCRTYTNVKKTLNLTNQQLCPVQIRISNSIKHYELQFYDFYDFQPQQQQQFKKKRLTIKNRKTNQLIKQNQVYSINAGQIMELQFQYSAMQPEEVNQQIEIQVLHGKTKKIPILVSIQQIFMQMSRSQINLRTIYKGNVYNSNKFLNKQLSIENKRNIQTTFQFVQPSQDSCIVTIDPMIFKLGPKQKKRIDLLIEPIKTGNFQDDIKWKFYDDFKINPHHYPQLTQFIEFNSQQDLTSIIKQWNLHVKAEIKGVQIKYYIKDEQRVKRVRQKLQDLPTSIKHSTMSFKSSKASNMHDQQKLVYPYLQDLHFYNCEINQVRQMQIIIENDSGLTAEFNIYAEKFHTLQTVNTSRKSTKGLVGQQEQAFSSEMGKTFIQNRVLDKSQKVHLSNNKGVSIMCEPANGFLHKKQTQKIVVTMFNDTSGRFQDNLVIDIKDHQQKKFPIDIHIKGTPVLLSRNQLGINFNEEIPHMNIGSVLTNNGSMKRTIKVVNKGPKQVDLSWKIYPYNKIDAQKDLFKLEFTDAAPGTDNIIDVKWNAIEPSPDESSPFIIEPKSKILKGREEVSFTLIVNELNGGLKTFQNLLICEPELKDGDRKIKMQNLAVAIFAQSVEPFLTTDVKHKNHINKLQLFATEHIRKQTNSNNNLRKLKLKNQLKANIQFDVSIETVKSDFQSFKIVSINTNSPINPYDGNKTFLSNKKYVLAYQSFIELTIELVANKKDFKDWPLQPKTRKDGHIFVKFSNGHSQQIDLVGWLYRPWVQLQMPNQLFYSVENTYLDFGTIHVKNSKKLSIYLINASKSDAKFNVTYVKYQQSKKINFQKALWTAQDYEDQNIVDLKQCFYLSQDQGVVLNNSIPIHFIPGTLALPSGQDEYTATHKPIRLDFMFKPKSNLLYKSKFRIAIEQGVFYDVIVRGKGSFDEELQKK